MRPLGDEGDASQSKKRDPDCFLLVKGRVLGNLEYGAPIAAHLLELI